MADEEIKEETIDVTTLDAAALDEGLAKPDEEKPAEEVKEPETKGEKPVEEKEEKPKEEVKPEPSEEEKAAKRIKDQETFIGKQTAEIGALRQQAQLLQEQLAKFDQEAINQEYFEDPTAAVNKVLEAKAQQAEVNRLQMLAKIKQNEVVVKEYVPDFDNLMDDMVETLKELKYAPEIIQNFHANPYAEQPAIVVNLAERARLTKENKMLKAEIETLRKKPEEALKKVEAAARTVVTGATGKSGGAASLNSKQVHQLSNAELEAALNEPD